jgi:hypothetical protein
MNIGVFPGCCTAMIIYEFRGSVEEIISEIKNIIKNNTKVYGSWPISSCGLILAITTQRQKFANEALSTLGFKSGSKIKKLAHSDNVLYLWQIHPAKLKKNIKDLEM